ncbi:MAG: mechanosensitive ion channel [Cyanobacteria bacterium]|nr:mechanosensitive ion channel [Cyanobacteria bacterium bin.51]
MAPLGRVPVLLSRLQRSLGLCLAPLLLGLALAVAPGLAPAQVGPATAAEAAELDPGSAFVVVDGVELFRVRSSNDYSAEQRVEAVNDVLSDTVASNDPAEVSVVERNGLPVIAIDDKPLLTVTRRDGPEGVSPEALAEIWRRQLGRAIERGRQERQPATVLRLVLISLGMLLGAWIVQRLLGLAFRRLFPQAMVPPDREAEVGATDLQGSRLLLRFLLRTLQLATWIGVIARCISLFPVSRTWLGKIRDALADSLASPFLPLGERSYSVLDILVLIALFLLLAKGLGVVHQLLRTRVLRYTGIGKGSQEAIAFIVQYTLLFVGSLVLLQLWGLDLSSLALFASVFGVALGLGLQGITKNFISGLIIIFERPIEVGDFVEIGALQGTVQRISLRCTEVVTLDRIAIIVPNSEFLESQVVNWSHGSPTSRLILPVGVAYESDCQEVRQVLIKACQGYGGILSEPPPKVFFKGFGDSSLDFSLLVWISQPMRQYEIISDLNFRIEAALRDHQITIPFPQRDLHLRPGSLQLSLPPELSDALRRQASSRRASDPPAASPESD